MHINGCNCGCNNSTKVNNDSKSINQPNLKQVLNQTSPLVHNDKNINLKADNSFLNQNLPNKMINLQNPINNFVSAFNANSGGLLEKIASYFAEHKKSSPKTEKFDEVKDESELFRLKEVDESNFGENKKHKKQNQKNKESKDEENNPFKETIL